MALIHCCPHTQENPRKLFIKIVYKRIYRRLEEDISNTQFGFLGRLGGAWDLFQRCRDINQEACYIDFEKAFDKVKGETWQTTSASREQKIDLNDVRILSNLRGQKANVAMVENQPTEEIRCDNERRLHSIIASM